MSEEQPLGLHNLRAPQGASKTPKRKGRGPGSGLGKTAGRGHKGQLARSGGRVRRGFEGGQMPLIRRVPKRGFQNRNRVVNQVVNLRDLNKVDGRDINPAVLAERGLIAHNDAPVKVLSVGEPERAYVVTGCAVSKAARAKIEQAGGRVETS